MKIRYINLERSPDRRARIEGLLAEQGLADISERFSGIVPETSLNGLALSVTGCLMSHLSLIDSLDESETTLILEDDACFSKNFSNAILNVPHIINDANFDVLFLGQTVLFDDASTHAELIKLMSELRANNKYRLLNGARFYRYGTFGYVINKNSVSKIRKLIDELDLTLNAKPIDNLLKQWIKEKKLNASVMLPYLIGVDPRFDSTMNDRTGSLRHQLHCELVNLYLNDQSSEIVTDWHKILSKNPNLDALEICKIMYTQLTL
jgi:GR25 family glycosyltransferase involved in LPS biosynthesis